MYHKQRNHNKKVLDKETQFRHTCLYLFQKQYSYLLKIVEKINGLNIFDKTFLYTAYLDDTTLDDTTLDTKSVIELLNVFDTFSKFSGLKPNKSKCEIAGIGALKGVQVALYGMRCIDLMSNIFKILGIYYSYNEKLEI